MDYKDLLEKAKEASKHAYAPYSDFPVGACVLAKSGKTYVGCNVENASYGLSICAERSAITNAISNGEQSLLAVAVWAPKMDKCLPCGTCRQFIFEFQKDEEIEIVAEENGEIITYKINDLLPEGFKL